MGICDISQERVTDDNCSDKRYSQNEQDSESHNIAILLTNEPNQDISDSPLPNQETGICDILQERVTDDNCKDKRDNQNKQASESHIIDIHVANEPNQDIKDNPLPSQETGFVTFYKNVSVTIKIKGTIRMSRTVRAIL